jgi:hypothetical protein
MKNYAILLSLCLIAAQTFSQVKPGPDPLLFRPATHSSKLKSTVSPYNGKSFYQSKADWQTIIDTTWGSGRPLNEKLAIFDAYTKLLTEDCAIFNSLGIDPTEWNSIKSSYRSRIDSSTSRGAFAALMGRLAYGMNNVWALAWDTTVLMKPLCPGTPVMYIGSFEVAHFGAVLTVLPDSSLLVLRTLENHPLGLEPGDIVLGYEGVPWKELVDELLDSGIPIFYFQRNAKSSVRYNELAYAGMNWHLFETIDIVKYASGDTLHLPVSSLLSLPVSMKEYVFGGEHLMWNNEQLPVPDVHFPDPVKVNEQSVTYGIVEGTNIGYIYIFEEHENTNVQFYNAVNSMMGTDGLIIDIRSNTSGWPIPIAGLNLLFNKHLNTIEDAVRCNNTDFSLCSLGNQNEYSINGDPMSWYDKPIALLTGPHSAGIGDQLAYMISYHPVARSFGKSTCAGPGNVEEPILLIAEEWRFWYPSSDKYLATNPEILLNGREFPVDEPVWFDREGVANGEDGVVNKALEWIQNLSYAHEAKVNPWYILPGEGEVTLTAKVENPNGHELSVVAYITSMDSTVKETVSLADDGNHNDGDAGDGIWGTIWPVPEMKAIFSADLQTKDVDVETTRNITGAVRFTTIGPVAVDRITYTGNDTIPNAGESIGFKISLRNQDLTTPVLNIRAKVASPDTALAKMPDLSLQFTDMAPGEESTSIGFMTFYINIADDCPENTVIPVKVEISSDYYTLWTDTISFQVLPTNIEEINTLQARVYPNPAEDRINIEIDNTGEQETVIELVTVTGMVIYRKEYRNNQDQFTGQIDVSGYARGMYFIRISQGGAVYNGKIVLGR